MKKVLNKILTIPPFKIMKNILVESQNEYKKNITIKYESSNAAGFFYCTGNCIAHQIFNKNKENNFS